MIENFLFYIKLFAYVWALSEMVILTVLYMYASTEMKDSRVIKSLTLLLFAVSTELIYRFILSYTTRITISVHSVMRDILIIPLILIIYSARTFRKASVSKGVKKLKE